MRINSANIPASVSKPNTTNTLPATDTATSRHQTVDARDSYRKNSSPQIIDAEYVEFYSPSVKHLNQERQALDNTLELGEDQLEISGNLSTENPPAVGKYALKAHEAPPPGSYVDIFA